MKILAIATGILLSISSFAQNQQWDNANLRADGQYILDGVEALYQKVTCGNDAFVLVKFINHNAQPVSVQWIDAIYENGAWVYEKNNTVITIQLSANQEIEGDCNTNNVLKIKIEDIISNHTQMQHYTVSALTVIK